MQRSRQSRSVSWGLFPRSKQLCNGVVAYVIIRPWGSPPLYKQAELISPSRYEDKDRHPLDSLSLRLDSRLSYLLYAAIKAAVSFQFETDARQKCEWNKTIKHQEVRLTNPHDDVTNRCTADSVLVLYIPDVSHVLRDHWSTEVIDFRQETDPFSAAGLNPECHDVTIQTNDIISSLLYLDQCRSYI